MLETLAFVLGGFIVFLIICSVIEIIREKKIASNRILVPYTLCFAVLLGFMIAFRNGRNWIITMAVIFLIFYLRMWLWDKTDRLLSLKISRFRCICTWPL